MNENQIKGGQTRGHLTSKEISQWLVEGPEQPADQHVQTCWACQAKLAEAKAPLAAFRTAVVGWSEAQNAGRAAAVKSLAGESEGHWGLRLWLPVASLALAALLIAGFVKVPGLLHGRSDGQQTAVSSPSSSESDAALMDQVDTEVSEAVPDAMAPLTDLVAWDSGEGVAEMAPAPEKTVAHKKSNPVTSAKVHAHPAN
jgi:hypothetical protein